MFVKTVPGGTFGSTLEPQLATWPDGEPAMRDEQDAAWQIATQTDSNGRPV
jgi:hypothetical protein